MHTTVAQNKAHHADMTWIKVGRSEYMRGDGVTIKKSTTIRAWWQVFLPTGEQATMPKDDGGYYTALSASGPSLTIAKYAAEGVTADTPAYAGRYA